MWVLYNNNGQVVTSIPHGEIVRQGSSASIYIAFSKDYFHTILGEQSVIYGTKSFLNAVSQKVNVSIGWDDHNIEYNPAPTLIQFKKIKDSESTILLEDGKNYLVYKVNLSSGETRYSGEHKLNVALNFLEYEGDVANIVDTETLGSINIYVEPTYGYQVPEDTVEKETAQLILAKLQQMVLPKLNIEDEKVKLIETNYESHHKFAEICSQDADREKRDRIYLGKVNGERVLGLASRNREVLVLNSTGVIGVSNGSEYVGITFPKLSATDLTAYRLKVDGGLTSPASIVRFTGDVTEENNPATKKYVDDLIAYIDDLINERIEEHTDTILNGVGQEGDTLKELFDLIEKNKNIIQVLQEATTKIKHEEEKTEIFQTLEKNYDYTFSSEGITKVSLTIPSDTSQGYLSGFSIKIGSEVPKINFINGSSFPALYTLNGTQRLFSKITFQPNQTLVGALMCDGINVYVYLKEMKNTVYLI